MIKEAISREKIVNGRTYKVISRSRPRTGLARAFVNRDADPKPTKEEYDALIAALDEANDTARRVLIQAERNLFNLRDARLEAETAHAIAAASNKAAAERAGTSK